jgi:AcrR family transcriptional regulator
MKDEVGRRQGGTRNGPVTPERVVDAALRLIDDEGLEALTMRRLAQELGVEPVTVYRQLPNKEAILAAVGERLWAEMPPPPQDFLQWDWRRQVRAMWLDLHTMMQAHPNAIPILARGSAYSSTASAGTMQMADVFRRGGLSPDDAAELLHIIGACVVGFGFATLWGRQAARGEGPDEPAGEPVAPPPELLPYLERMARWDPRQFERALDIVLAAYGGGGTSS